MNRSFVRTAAALAAAALLFTGCQSAGAAASEAVSSEAVSSGVTGVDTTAEMPNYSIGLTEDGSFEGYDMAELITLPDYEAIPADETFTTVSDEDLQAAIDEFLADFGTATEVTDRAVVAGDTVNIDYVGTIDGVAFDGGDTQGAGADYTAGSDELIDDFLDQIIGVMPGETVDVVVTFPEDYGVDTLNGKEAVFATTVNYIHGEDSIPALDEEFISIYGSYYGVSSVEELRQMFIDELLGQQQYNFVLDWLFTNCTFNEVPAKLVDDQVSVLETELNSAAAGLGVTTQELAEMYEMESIDALLETYRPILESMVKQNMMCQALAEDAGIELTDEVVSEYFANLGITNFSTYTADYGQGYIYQGVRTDLVAEYLINHVVTE
ncbi:MAG: FKBP-type peptidyl-prolyl cis-trans isomerase [Oscillospiraceae bacterium]|nr:FKBP-type peptidyl-prolyl cis-trans isomerase [Oscillospiraceae bacterium]